MFYSSTSSSTGLKKLNLVLKHIEEKKYIFPSEFINKLSSETIDKYICDLSYINYDSTNKKYEYTINRKFMYEYNIILHEKKNSDLDSFLKKYIKYKIKYIKYKNNIYVNK